MLCLYPSLINDSLKILISAFFLWILVDVSVTNFLGEGVRGMSQFYEHSEVEGRQNRAKFSGRFGGFLNDFSNIVNIGALGERLSLVPACDDVRGTTLF